MKSKKVFAEINQIGSFSNVKFMMKSDDFRLKDDSFGYKVLDDNPIYNHKQKTLTTKFGVYQVFSDWSLKLIDSKSDVVVTKTEGNLTWTIDLNGNIAWEKHKLTI